MSSTSNGFLFKNCYGYCSISGNNLQGSSHRLKAVGGAYDKGKDLFMKYIDRKGNITIEENEQDKFLRHLYNDRGGRLFASV